MCSGGAESPSLESDVFPTPMNEVKMHSTPVASHQEDRFNGDRSEVEYNSFKSKDKVNKWITNEKVVLDINNIPKHSHKFNPYKPDGSNENQSYDSNCSNDVKKGKNTTCKAFIPTTKENIYQGTQNMSFEPVGGGRSHNNLPPYYGMFFIIKLKEKEN